MKEMSLREVQQICLELMKMFHDFCTKNGIRYSLCAGSLLGAIRHNGFIPWDDDIDVLMPRPDYDKFINTFCSDDNYRLYCRNLADCRNKSGYPYARLCEMKRTFVNTGSIPWCLEKTGIWMDIYPCDGAPGNYKEAVKYVKKNNWYAKASQYSLFSNLSWSFAINQSSFKDKLKVSIKKAIAMFISSRNFDNYCLFRNTYSLNNAHYYMASSHYGIKEWQPKSNIESFILHKFENCEFYIMSGYDHNLKMIYGDYLSLPPEEERAPHHFNMYYWR